MDRYASFIDDATADEIRELARQGFATVLAVADPPRDLSIYRTDAETGRTDIVIVDTFSVKIANVQAQGGGDEGATRTSVAGTIRRFIPDTIGATRLQPGDRFTLQECGPCIVQSLRPDKYGIETGEYALEEGAS